MSIKNLSQSGCGCSSPSTPKADDLTIVPAGSMIVQTPCAEGCAPKSSVAVGEFPGGSPASSDCDTFRNPCILQNFDAAALNRSGSFFARCASAWGAPGAIVYFPGMGFVEVLGVSGDVVTYRNLTIEPGTQLLAGTCFLVGPPQPPVATDDEGAVDDPWQDSSTLDAVYGVEGNVPKKVVPGNGTILYGCGGKWQRRQAGLMFYPVSLVNLVSFNGAASNKTWTPSLPNKPTKPSCSLGLWVQLAVRISSTSTSSGVFPTNAIDINGRRVVTAHAHPSFQHNNNDVMVNTNDAATITIEAKKLGSNGNMNVGVDLLGYWY